MYHEYIKGSAWIIFFGSGIEMQPLVSRKDCVYPSFSNMYVYLWQTSNLNISNGKNNHNSGHNKSFLSFVSRNDISNDYIWVPSHSVYFLHGNEATPNNMGWFLGARSHRVALPHAVAAVAPRGPPRPPGGASRSSEPRGARHTRAPSRLQPREHVPGGAGWQLGVQLPAVGDVPLPAPHAALSPLLIGGALAGVPLAPPAAHAPRNAISTSVLILYSSCACLCVCLVYSLFTSWRNWDIFIYA